MSEIKAKWYLCDLHACGHVRGEIVARHVNEHSPHEIICKSDVLMSDYPKTTAMIWQRLHGEGLLSKMRHAKKCGITCVYDVDDDLFSIPEDFDKAYAFYGRPDIRASISAFMSEVDIVTVSTTELAEALRCRTDSEIRVIENAIDVDYWKACGQRPAADGSVTIGWMASQFHSVDVPLILEGLEHCLELYPNVRVKFIGMVDKDKLVPATLRKYSARIEVMPWVDISELPRAMASFDINLCPIVDTPFNRCKSGVKALQAAALGVPSIVSPLAPYAHCRDGADCLTAKGNTANGWTEAMDSLVRDEALRRKLGAAAHETVNERWHVRRAANDWIRLLSQLKGG